MKGAPADAPKDLELLKGITGWAQPGQLTALMGGSGAGKTTLMDCVAGRKTVGEIRGDITVNGHPKVQATWSRVMGYVEQMDIHTAAQVWKWYGESLPEPNCSHHFPSHECTVTSCYLPLLSYLYCHTDGPGGPAVQCAAAAAGEHQLGAGVGVGEGGAGVQLTRSHPHWVTSCA